MANDRGRERSPCHYQTAIDGDRGGEEGGRRRGRRRRRRRRRRRKRKEEGYRTTAAFYD